MRFTQHAMHCLVAACMCLQTGCLVGQRVEPNAQQNRADGPMPILRDFKGPFGGFRRPVRAVIHDPGMLAMMPIDIGQVDFDREMVLVAAMGPAPSPNYDIEIHGVEADGRRIYADVRQVYPPIGAARTGPRSSPYHVVVVPKSTLPIEDFAGVFPAQCFESPIR